MTTEVVISVQNTWGFQSIKHRNRIGTESYINPWQHINGKYIRNEGHLSMMSQCWPRVVCSLTFLGPGCHYYSFSSYLRHRSYTSQGHQQQATQCSSHEALCSSVSLVFQTLLSCCPHGYLFTVAVPGFSSSPSHLLRILSLVFFLFLS